MYGGFSFVKFGDLWYSQVRKNNTVYDVTFNYDPKSVENITVDGQLTAAFTKGRHIYITFDPEATTSNTSPWRISACREASHGRSTTT